MTAADRREIETTQRRVEDLCRAITDEAGRARPTTQALQALSRDDAERLCRGAGVASPARPIEELYAEIAELAPGARRRTA